MEKHRVFFHKPNLELFHSMGLSSVDMHFHTRFSDSYTRVSTIIKKARKKKMGVAITDHNTIEGSIKASKNNMGVMVIPGIEISCIEGPHILLYFYTIDELKEFHDKHIEPKKQGNPYMAVKLSVEELLEKTKDFSCIRVAAHPYGFAIANQGLLKSVHKQYIDGKVFDDIDSMEVICGGMTRRLNRKAERKAEELGKGFTGGSDGHTIFELGKVVTSSYAHDTESFLQSIARKKNFVIGTEIRTLPKLLHGTNVMSRHMRYAVPSLRMQYQMNKGRVKNMPAKLKRGSAAIRERFRSMRNGKD
jgi:predicted metal-dependent phosphoesterase TrpH